MTRNISVLVFPDFQLLDAAGPLSVFEIAGRETGSPAYRLRVVAGGLGSRPAAACAETLAYIRAAALRARRVASVCTGAFVLAAAGLLDGRRATTHWRW